MTEKKRRSSRAVQAREAAREKAAKYAELETERLRIAEAALLLQDEIDEFDEETQRRVEKLIADRDEQLKEKHGKVQELVVAMLDTNIPAQEAADRLGMSVNAVRAAKREFDKAVAALAEKATQEAAGVTNNAAGAGAAEQATEAATATESPAPEAGAAQVETAISEATPGFSYPPPTGSEVVPPRESPEGAPQGVTLPPGSAV